jgi:hypothetical protein
MRTRFFSSTRRHTLTGILLGLLLLRAYVPVGFMPASGKPFQLELCPAAAPLSMEGGTPAVLGVGESMSASMSMAIHMPMHMHGAMDPMRHSGSHGHFDNCPFGSVPAAGPVSHVVAFQPGGDIAHHSVAVFQSWRSGQRWQRANQPRGPPLLS